MRRREALFLLIASIVPFKKSGSTPCEGGFVKNPDGLMLLPSDTIKFIDHRKKYIIDGSREMPTCLTHGTLIKYDNLKKIDKNEISCINKINGVVNE